VPDHRAYYEASLRLLKHVEARLPSNRRFGPEADALWAQFHGELTTADRIDILLRDADAQWPGAFGARSIFNLAGASEDDPFGVSWVSLEGMEAEELWRTLSVAEGASIAETLQTVAAVWGIRLTQTPSAPIGPAEQLIAVGPSAVASLVSQFAGNTELSWADQVTVVATPPGHRHLAAAAGALLGATSPTRLLAAQGARASTATKPRLLLSSDAAEPDAQWARVLAGQTDA
jgi:hypothetical protein